MIARNVSERLLLRAYGVRLEGDPRPCACGGRIGPVEPERVAEAVRQHNATQRHQAWRAWREAQG